MRTPSPTPSSTPATSPAPTRSSGRISRLRIATIVATVGVVLVGVATCGCTDARSEPAAPAPCSLAAGNNKVANSPGAQVLSASDADMNRELTTSRDMGMWSVRIDVDWSVVQPRRGVWNWAPIDRVVNAVVANGLCPLGLATYTPIWAARPSDFPTNSHFRPADPAVFADFAAAAARRYASSIKVWEIWNEPNLANYWLPRASSTEYGRLLQAASSAIKRAAPGTAVVSAGLAPGADNGRDIAPLTFVRSMYAAKVNSAFDALGVHPYTYPALPNDPASAPWSTAQKMWDMRAIMEAAGDSAKPIWMTEFGAPTGSAPNSVSEDTQAESFRIALQAQRDTPWLGPMYIYSIRDTGTDPNDLEQNFGLLHYDWSAKKAFGVVEQFAKQ